MEAYELMESLTISYLEAHGHTFLFVFYVYYMLGQIIDEIFGQVLARLLARF